ncbi:MAG: selenocysteine-specific translation elongation factor [Sphingomonadales bacterium]|nr:selenocysteine-specific translation elongation factor [Sphingomonadales bacterium]
MIVGTAGHIDHGKTALVRALTGVETDRLKEEKARGISIDLGFAYLPGEADGDGVLGFVDVPGHDRFVRNMLAGATGIDFALLVVAADDGLMPQTREHLAILDLLGLSRGAAIITKCDLVEPARIAALTGELAALLAPTSLAAVPIMAVSSATGDGIADLRALLFDAAARDDRAAPAGRFRLAVDRSFSLAGAGTVVTGAMLSGSVALGDMVTISPSGLRARVRSIHAQNRPIEQGRAGDRCALNLAGEGISRHAIARGDMILDAALHAPTRRIDARLRLLPGEPRPLAHWTPVRLHHGAAERSARVALLQEEPVAPGEEALVQLVLDEPIAASVGDRFIVRDTAASRTMGGGTLLDLRAPQRRRRTPQRLAVLEALSLPDPAEALGALLERWPHHVEQAAFFRDRAMTPGEQADVLAHVPHSLCTQADALFSPAIWAALQGSACAALAAFHRSYPQLLGMGAVRLASALEPRLPARIGQGVVAALVESGLLAAQGGAVRLPEHQLGLDKADQTLWACIAPLLGGEARFRPPRVAEIAEALRLRLFDVRRVLKSMARRGDVVEIAPDHFFLRETEVEMAHIAADVAQHGVEGEFGAALFRDRLANGRKVAIQILDHFDRHGLTLRRGDLRRINGPKMEAFLAAQRAPA